MKMFDFSSVLIRKCASKSVFLACAMTASTAASADIQVSAFAEARGFHALMDRDLEQASKVLPAHSLGKLDYAAANNLCVLQILKKEEAVAVKTCGTALTKVAATSMKRTAKKKITAEIYANLGAAQMLGGDYPAAQQSFDKALSLSRTADRIDSTAEKNQEALRSRLLAAN